VTFLVQFGGLPTSGIIRERRCREDFGAHFSASKSARAARWRCHSAEFPNREESLMVNWNKDRNRQLKKRARAEELCTKFRFDLRGNYSSFGTS
jgi:hypothetical protein